MHSLNKNGKTTLLVLVRYSYRNIKSVVLFSREETEMEKIRVAVIFGGCSNEYEVSLQSAYAVITNMDPQKYESILIGITREGHWYRYYGEPKKIQQNLWFEEEEHCIPVVLSPNRYANTLLEFKHGQIIETIVDIAFPILHGKNGEDGTLQGLLELVGVPYVGCDTLSSALCMDKDRAHKLVEHVGIRTPASVVFSRNFTKEQLRERTDHLKYPLMVKPVKSGSSIGISLVRDEAELPIAITQALNHDFKVIVEEYIEGFEVGCAILGNEELIIGEVDEIELQYGFFDFMEKYTLAHSRIHMPARIDHETAIRVKETAVKIYRTLGCAGLARVDMFLTADNQIVFNEVNTFPGFTDHSRYPNMMKGIGLEFSVVIDHLIQLGLER